MYTLAPHTFPTPQDLQKMLGFSVGFDGFFNRLSNMDIAQSGYPPYNIRKLNDLQYVVELALAGFSKSDIEVEVTDGTLTIRSAIAKDDGADNDENIMKTKYKLIVKESGNYTSDSLSSLIWTVFKHRCEHLFKGEGWRD